MKAYSVITDGKNLCIFKVHQIPIRSKLHKRARAIIHERWRLLHEGLLVIRDDTSDGNTSVHKTGDGDTAINDD